MKGLEETGQAPIGTVNQLVILPPASATQKEVGIRSTYFQGISASLAYFNIVRANAVTDAKSDVFLIDGTNKFQGWESTVTADINPWWKLSFAGQLLDAKQNPLIDPTLRGLTPENTAKLSGNFSVSHRSQLVPGLTLRAGMSYVGRRYVNSLDQASIPGVVLYTLGAGYATTIGGHRTVLQLSVDNLTNKRYWNSATTSAYGTGMERSLRANAKIDF
jgi:iron complex outermembrane receptor protein